MLMLSEECRLIATAGEGGEDMEETRERADAGTEDEGEGSLLMLLLTEEASESGRGAAGEDGDRNGRGEL